MYSVATEGFVVRTDEKLSAFLELELEIRGRLRQQELHSICQLMCGVPFIGNAKLSKL
jgi:hypothetical protein